jgi:hypothetical protein
MPIPLKCDCGRSLRVKDELAGRKVRCPVCKCVLAVPQADQPLEVIPAESPFSGARASDSDSPPLVRRKYPSTPEEDVDPEPKPVVRRKVPQSDPDEDSSEPIVRAKYPSDSPPRPRPPGRLKRRPRKSRDGLALEEGWFGSMNAGVIGGVIMMVIAVVWFVVGLHLGWIFFYPPILFIIGIGAFIKGLVGHS